MTTTHEMTPQTLNYLTDTMCIGDRLRVRFIGDIHYNAPGCDKTALRRVLRNWADDPLDALYVTMGDLCDFASGSEKKAVRDGMHESNITWTGEKIREEYDKLLSEMHFMDGNLLGCIEGNHSWIWEDGQSSDQYVAEQLGGTWLGGLGSVDLCMPIQGRPGITYTVKMAMHHGKGGGRTPGGSINAVDKMRDVINADVYAMGHNHQIGAMPTHAIMDQKTPKDRKGQRRVIGMGFNERSKWIVRTGSFLRMCAVGKPGYGVAALFPPAQLGAVEISIEIRRNRKNGQDTLYHVIDGSVVR
jgi:hypothetical protein